MKNLLIRPRDHAVLAVLRQHFPKLFGRDLLIKVGIDRELYPLFAGKLTKRDIRGAIKLYTEQSHYISRLWPGAPRFDLQGKPCGTVEEKHVQWRKEEVERFQRREKKRMAMLKKFVPSSQRTGPKPSERVTTARVAVKGAKFALPLAPEQLSRVILPPEGQGGKLKLVLEMENTHGPALKLEAIIAVKNYRKALARIDELQGNVVVMLQGRLLGDRTVEGAGLIVQPRAANKELLEEIQQAET